MLVVRGVLPEKSGTKLMNKIRDFPYPIWDLTKNSIPMIYDVGRALVDGFIDNDEKVASKKTYPIQD